MDRRSWLWRRKSSEKNPGESESSDSVSSHSERYSDDQEALRPNSNNASPNHCQSPEVSSRIRDETQETETAPSLNEKLALAATSNDPSPQHDKSPQPEVSSTIRGDDVQETVKTLSEKLSAAVLTIGAKEDLVKQHAKVAEEAVAGWEQAEVEVTALKRLLEAASQKNSSLEDQVSHLDGALKECVRQLRQSREEEEKVHVAVTKKSQELESEKSDLQNQIAELKQQLEATKLEAAAVSVQHDLQEKLQAIERENMDLKAELLAQSKDLKIITLERDLSNQAAETASKQHLESAKKITRAEAECRRLRQLMRRTSLANNDSRPSANNVCMESLTDSQSDNGEQMLAVDSEMGNSDSWASALIAKLDQFKNGKGGTRSLVNNPVEIDLMDDFLEMEKLASLPEADHVSSSFGMETDSDQAVTRDSSRDETEAMRHQVADLEAKVEKIEGEKKELEEALGEARNQLDTSCDSLNAAKNKLIDLQMQLDLANESKNAALGEVECLDGERTALELQLESKSVEVDVLRTVVASLEESADMKELELQLELTSAEAASLRKTVASLEEKIGSERALSVQHKTNAEAAEIAKESLEAKLQLANSEVGKLQGIMKSLECEAQKEKVLREELMAQVEAAKIEVERTLSAETAKESLEAQLQVANSEVAKLRGMVNTLEFEVENGKAFSAELKMQLESGEGIRKVLESEVKSAREETGKLREKVESLEAKLKEQAASLVEFTVNIEAAVSYREAMGCQLEAANLELVKLTNKVSVLQGKIEQEKMLSEEYEAKCRKLEAQLSRDSREAKLWRLANANGDLKVKQEKELVSAAGKLAECQRTIASLGQQLKSLTDIDGVVPEPEKPESRDMLLDFRNNGDAGLLSADFADGLCNFDLTNNNSGSCFSQFPSIESSSPPSEMSVFSGGLSSLSSYRSKTRK